MFHRIIHAIKSTWRSVPGIWQSHGYQVLVVPLASTFMYEIVSGKISRRLAWLVLNGKLFKKANENNTIPSDVEHFMRQS